MRQMWRRLQHSRVSKIPPPVPSLGIYIIYRIGSSLCHVAILLFFLESQVYSFLHDSPTWKITTCFSPHNPFQHYNHNTLKSFDSIRFFHKSCYIQSSSLASTSMSEFQRRMLDRIKKEDARERREKRGFLGEKKDDKASIRTSTVHGTPLNFHIVHTLEQFKRIIVDEYKDKIIVVRFFAPWCKACKAMAPSFHRLALIYPRIEFVDIPVSPDNINLHQGFGIQTLPFGHVYYPHAGLVEEMVISRKHFPKFVRILQTYSDGQCLLPDDDEDGEGSFQNPFQNMDDTEVVT